MKNLVYMGKVLRRCETAGVLQQRDGEEEYSDGEKEQTVRDLKWLVERMLRLARFEAARHPKESIKVFDVSSLLISLFFLLFPPLSPPSLPLFPPPSSLLPTAHKCATVGGCHLYGPWSRASPCLPSFSAQTSLQGDQGQQQDRR